MDATEVHVSQPKPPPSEIDAFLDILVPADEVTIEDIAGATYRVPGRIPAIRQITVMRHIREILLHRALTNTVAAAMGGAPKAEGLATAFGSVLVGLADPELINKLGEAFEAAHPTTLEAARKAAGTRGEGTDGRAVDLFAVEEMAAALAPLFIRLGRRLLAGVRGMAPMAAAQA